MQSSRMAAVVPTTAACCPATRLVARPFAACRGAQRRSACRRAAVVRAAAGGAQQADVVVVGAGVAGLNAAAKLHQAGVPVLLVEASDGVGGRVSGTSCLLCHVACGNPTPHGQCMALYVCAPLACRARLRCSPASLPLSHDPCLLAPACLPAPLLAGAH